MKLAHHLNRRVGSAVLVASLAVGSFAAPTFAQPADGGAGGGTGPGLTVRTDTARDDDGFDWGWLGLLGLAGLLGLRRRDDHVAHDRTHAAATH